MYQREHIALHSEFDGLELAVLMVRPEGEVLQVLQMVHGMSEYKERYLPLMEYLAERGIATIIHDHRGHGKSMRDEGDKGFLYGAGSRGLIEDTLVVREYALRQFPGKPLSLFGHSMGSLVARCFMREHDETVEKLVLSGPPTQNPAAGAGLLLAKTQRAVWGGRSPGKLLQAMAFGGYLKRFPQSRCAWVCGDPAVVKAYEEDPMCGFIFTADGYVGLMELMAKTYASGGWHCNRPDTPILFLGGEEDPCIDGGEKFAQAQEHMRRIGYQNVSGKLYPGMRHEICNEQDREVVYQDIANFLLGNQ